MFLFFLVNHGKIPMFGWPSVLSVRKCWTTAPDWWWSWLNGAHHEVTICKMIAGLIPAWRYFSLGNRPSSIGARFFDASDKQTPIWLISYLFRYALLLDKRLRFSPCLQFLWTRWSTFWCVCVWDHTSGLLALICRCTCDCILVGRAMSCAYLQ